MGGESGLIKRYMFPQTLAKHQNAVLLWFPKIRFIDKLGVEQDWFTTYFICNS